MDRVNLKYSVDLKELAQLLDIVHSANIGIVVIDRDLTVSVFNRFMQVHSHIDEQVALGQSLLTLFLDLPEQWLQRRVQAVLNLDVPIYTTWEERPFLFRFPLRLPIHYEIDLMMQNITMMPLHGTRARVERVGIVVYDVTDSALARRQLEAAKLELLQLSRTDRLTELWSRGYWEERLQQEWQRARRGNGPASVVMFDIDHFKRINDTYGHQTGDEAIRAVARTVRETAREIDICGRYGGEEFAVILPNTPRSGALRFCERLRLNIARQIIKAHGANVQFTISLGIAEFDARTNSALEWLERADQALYRAKGGGRNQTRVFEAVPG